MFDVGKWNNFVLITLFLNIIVITLLDDQFPNLATEPTLTSHVMFKVTWSVWQFYRNLFFTAVRKEPSILMGNSPSNEI